MGIEFEILYHFRVKTEDIATIDTRWRNEIRRAIEAKLASNPLLYGKPLRSPLQGFWKIRVGDYRIVFTVEKACVRMYIIAHRAVVYDMLHRRL